MEHRLKRNTLTKIVVLYLSLFLVFGVLFISLYSSCYRILYRDTLSKSESRLNAGLEAFRDDLTRMMLLVNDYSATDEYLLLRAVNDPATVQNSLAMNKACEKLHSILDIENSYVKQVYSLFLNNNLFLSDRTSSMDYGQSFGILIRSKSGTLSAQDWKRSHFDSILPIRLLNGSDISSAYLPEDTNLLLCVVKTDNVTRKASDVVVFMIIYTLQTLFYNVGWTAMRAVIGKVAKNKADVVALNTSAQSAGTISSILYGYIGYPILGIALWAGTKQAYGCASAIYGLTIILGAIYMFCAFGKYEHQADEAAPVKKQRTGFFEMFKALKGPMVPFFCSYSFSAASVGFFMTLLVYYTTYVLNDPAAAAKSLSWNAIVGLIGCLITPWLTKRLSKKAIHVGGMILSAVGYVALALFGSKALPFIAIRAAINLVGCPSTCVMSALCNDIGDNIEMQGKEAPRAFLQGLAGATTRVGLILSSSISAFSMAAIGYVPGMEFTPELIQKMVILIAVIPAVVCAIAGACMIFYRLDEKQIAEYNAKKYGSVQ